jgi:hypothetical protein
MKRLCQCLILAVLVLVSLYPDTVGRAQSDTSPSGRRLAPERWSFRVEYRTRRSPQFPWGPWHTYKVITGDYATAWNRAVNVSDFIDGRSKNDQSRIIPKRLR